MNENKRALAYLGVAILIVVGWMFWQRQSIGVANRESGIMNNESGITNQETTVDEPDGKGGAREEENLGTRLKKWTTWISTAVGFSVGMPAGWYVPDSADNDPHFYSCPGYECEMVFEVQRSDDLAANGFDKVMEDAKVQQLRPVEVRSLVRGARVIKSDSPGGAEGWNDQYLIIFDKEQRGYTVFVNGWRVERLILSSFKLLQ